MKEVLKLPEKYLLNIYRILKVFMNIYYQEKMLTLNKMQNVLEK